MGEPRDQLDEALDEALASYGEAPENEGLERRILARVAGASRRTYSMRLPTMAVGAAAIAITACLLLWLTPKLTLQTLPANTTAVSLSRVEAPRMGTLPMPKPAAVPANAAKSRRFRKRPTEPKLAVFPTPTPLSNEERALLQLVTHHAKYIPGELTSLDSPVKPIYISALEIKPIQLGGPYTKEKRCCDQ